MSVTIIVIDGDGATQRSNLKDKMPAQVREALDAIGKDVAMSSGEDVRRQLPAGFPDKFVVPEEILFFPDEKQESPANVKARKRLNDRLQKMIRKSLPGNAEA